MPDKRFSAKQLQSLVRPDSVHRSVYTDPGIFALEQERIFKRTWHYLGHQCQLPGTGDYLTASLAGQPVAVIRQEDNSVRVLANRCAHRGAQLLNKPAGNTRLLRCSYHGWSYETNGCLAAIPCRENYSRTHVANKQEEFNLPVHRSDSYRGFIFATLAADAPALPVYLGNAARALDNMEDRSPAGELLPVPGCFRAIYRNNWKIYLENLHDGMHPLWVHQSSIRASRQQAGQQAGVPLAVRLIEANAQPPEEMQELEVTNYVYGHSDMRGFRNPDNLDDPVVQAYHALHRQRHGPEQSAEILNTNLHNVNLYPGTSAHPRFLQMRTITPLSVDQTAIDIRVFRWKDAPDEINRRNIIYANTVHSPSSLIKPDDLAVYRRVQDGLAAEDMEWISQHSLFSEEVKDTGTSTALSEAYIRNQYRAWLQYMCVEDT